MKQRLVALPLVRAVLIPAAVFAVGVQAVPAGVTVPEIVVNGRPGVRACGSCHLPNGFGRPESASLAGQPATYIEAQMADYRRGARKSAEAAAEPAATMSGIATAANETDVRAAAAYFAAVPYASWIRVVEVEKVPTGALEPIGNRIFEVPRDRARIEDLDDASGFVAYVPIGSVTRGETLVTTGAGGRTVRCALCHGDDLTGLGRVPGIAGRSPSYQIRQLRDMQRGVRQGAGVDLMKPTLARLSERDMIAIVAYTASRRP